MAVGDVYEMVIQAQEPTYGTHFLNVFHFQAVTALTTADGLLVDWIANVQNNWRLCLSSDILLEKYTCTNMIPFQTQYSERIVNVAGNDAAASLPPSSAAVITWRTGLAGRRKRGRTFIGGIYQAENGKGRWITSFMTTRLQVVRDSIINRYSFTGTSADWRIGVWSRVLGNQTPPFNVAGFQVITSGTAQPMVCTMGTRKVGRGF